MGKKKSLKEWRKKDKEISKRYQSGEADLGETFTQFRKRVKGK